MDKEQAVTWISESHRKRDMRQRKIADLKRNIFMFSHKVFYRTLYLIGIGRLYSKAMCKLGLYSKFVDGRCMWCGNTHNV